MKKFLKITAMIVLLAALTGCGAGAGVAAANTPSPAPTTTPSPTASPTPEPTPSPTPTPEPEARELTAEAEYRNDVGYDWPLFDGDHGSYVPFRAGNSLHIEAAEPIGALYMGWVSPPAEYTVEGGEGSVTGGENGFLHEYIRLDGSTGTLDLSFTGNAYMTELRVFGPGAAPEDVQVWDTPCEQADVLVFPSHADDDVIFFGAMIASCVDRGLDVQVSYLVNHYDWQPRPQELLDALWAMGIRHYPVIGPFPDYYVLNVHAAESSFGWDAVEEYQVEQIRRFRPSVVVGHDRQGEYGHGAHQLNALVLEEAVKSAQYAEAFPEMAEELGTWTVSKLYLHFAEENPIYIDVETPLASFGGRTAFKVASDAMYFHESQLQYPHRPTLGYNEDFPRYDCRAFGLVYTTVGEDTGNDIMEHIE